MLRLLVVDDDDQFRSMLKQVTMRFGFLVDSASNGVEALHALDRATYDGVIVDIFMPEKEGLETIKEIRQRFPMTRIIAVSGGSSMSPTEFNLKVAKRIGADATLAKPFQLSELLTVLRNLLGSEFLGDLADTPPAK